MKIKLVNLEKSQIKAEVKFEPVEVTKIVDEVIAKYLPSIEVKGFRKGHVPKLMVFDQIGLGRIQQEVLERAVNRAIMTSIKEHKIQPIGSPSLAVVKFSVLPDGKIREEMIFNLTFDIMPKVELGDYSKIKIDDKKLFDPKVDVTQEEIEKVIEHLRRQKSSMVAKSGKVSEGDWVEISFTGEIKRVAQEKLSSTHHPLIVGSGSMVPGFEEAIIGMEKDQKKDVEITFPTDYFAKEFGGKKAQFNITLHEIKIINLPKPDDEFSQSFGHNDIEKLKNAISQQLMQEKIDANKQKLESAILEKATKLLKVTVPPELIHQEVDRIIKRMRESIEKQGASFDRYLESIKKTNQDLHNEVTPQAKANIEIGLLLGEIIKREKLDVNDKEAPKKAMEKLVTIVKRN